MNENLSDYYLIKWERKYELGILIIDEQHKKLVDLTNRFYLEIMSHKSTGKPKLEGSLKKALEECVFYIKHHFKTEESLMQLVGYEKLEEHRAIHRTFIQEVTNNLMNFNNATFYSALKFVKFLYEWILAHIGIEDKQYVSAVNKYYEQL